MNNVTTITAGLWAKVQVGEFIGKDDCLPAEVQAELNRQTATVINGLFRQLRAIFPAWKQAWPDMTAYKAAKKEWLQGFLEAGLRSLDQLQFGLMRARQSSKDFVPNVGTFIDWCTPTPEMMGMPPLAKAFREACRNAHPSMAGQGRWSHDAVWHTAKECGFENLNRLDASLSLKLFERNYVITVRRVVAGKPLKPMPLALPEHIAVRSTRDTATSALNAIRAARVLVVPAMRNPMLALPNRTEYRFAVYSGSYELDLTHQPEKPAALYPDEDQAVAHGARMWPSTFKVVDLSEFQP